MTKTDRTETPKFTATTIVRENDNAWWVACESGCGAEITVPKFECEPINYAKPELGRIKVTFTAPRRMICPTCFAKGRR